MKAAHTEVKATFSNIHAAQALYMVDNNVYAATLPDIGVAIPDGTYNYRDEASGGTLNAFKLEKTDGTTDTADTSVFQLYASSKNKLAGCSTNASDVWCLDHTKYMSNTSITGANCQGTLVDGGAGC